VHLVMPGLAPGIHAPEPVGRGNAELGKTYPEPIIEHRLGRERALKAYAKIRARSVRRGIRFTHR
jgi:deoxyribodipyrimidine photo-lyase